MTTQNYFVVENNVVNNLVVWDGDVNTWQPPADATMLVQATTTALLWQSNNQTPPAWVLTPMVGAGNIGFTWNGTDLVTNEPEPTEPPITITKPISTGTVSA